MQNTESNYLIKLKIAIDKAKQNIPNEGKSFAMGWEEALDDLSYASKCGELAAKQHIWHWKDSQFLDSDYNYWGYYKCINFVESEMIKCGL